jgi:ribosomal protein S18 acetylase RimI-like enzyme
MRVISLHDRKEIERILRRNAALHIYELGDLDGFFWPYTMWYGSARLEQREISEIALLYSGMPTPILLGLSDNQAQMQEFLQAITHLLPRRFDVHLTVDPVQTFGETYRIRSFGEHYKMALTNPARLENIDTSAVQHLSPADLPEIEAFYAASYPDNAFDPRMLETGQYYGVRHEGLLASIAGIHAYSPTYRVAALGNITTRPEMRGRGLAKRVSARLCQQLLHVVDTIGLNVKADNQSAIACYQQLGFTRVASYEECACELKI